MKGDRTLVETNPVTVRLKAACSGVILASSLRSILQERSSLKITPGPAQQSESDFARGYECVPVATGTKYKPAPQATTSSCQQIFIRQTA